MSAAALAWLQLRHQPVRLGVAVAGVAFAVILMLMQLGFMDALFRSAVAFHRTLDADLVLISTQFDFLAQPKTFSRRRLYQALGAPGVASVAPLYASVGLWKNPYDGSSRNIFILGIDPSAPAVDLPDVRSQLALIRLPDMALFDSAARPEYGPVADQVRVIWESPKLPEDPIIWRSDLDPAVKEKLRQFFLTYAQGEGPEAERQRKLLAALSIGGFRPADNSHLLPVREMEATEQLLEARNSGDKVKEAQAQKSLDAIAAERAALEAKTGQPVLAQ